MAFGDFGGRTWNFFVPYTQISLYAFSFFLFLLHRARLLQEEDGPPANPNIPPFSRFPFFLRYISYGTGHAQNKDEDREEAQAPV
jgi:hypothetical protein